jgi:DNA polymerase-3 subunit delta
MEAKTMDVKTLQQKLKTGDIAPLYLILGEETALQETARSLFAHLLTADEKTMNYAHLDMTTATVGDLLGEATAMPFLGERRVVVATQPEFLTGNAGKDQLKEDIDGLTAYFAHPSESTTLVIAAPYPKLDERRKIVKQLRKNAVLIDAQQVPAGAVGAQVAEQIRTAGYQIEEDALNLFLRKSDASYSRMVTQLPKLYLGSLPDKVISLPLVRDLVPNTLTDNVFSVTDALAQQHVGEAVRVYQELLANQEEPLRLNALLVSQFRLLVQTKILSRKGLSQMAIAKELSVHPYRVKLALRSVHSLSLTTLIACFTELIHNEVLFKSQQPDPMLLFLRVVHHLSVPAGKSVG